ncbi:RAD26-like SNF2 family DNA-dependent ATPase [Hygrophoropsis aurantiaca]|uniref:RAD26-like SNF2 family DNA-dependent ATPase n=1 Tax=Hygrophoropsis aurantiaca TaxID=72124 RepID=A0ACB8A932_9AGAM|nr:RAD26-like SNF2 family DNA-dependent ATPase [Hygrophoropsis aurantiaca]
MSKEFIKAGQSAYNRRNLNSIAAPLESDSDPEFNSGVFVYETKKRGKRKARSPESSTSPRKSRKQGKDRVRGTVASSRKGRVKRDIHPQHNPLQEFFEDSLGLQSASEDDYDAATDGEGDFSEPDEKRQDSDTESPVMLKTMAGFNRSSNETTVSHRNHPNRIISDGDSATEPESSSDEQFNSIKRKAPISPVNCPPAKRMKTPVMEDASVTESESDHDTILPAKVTVSTSSPPGEDSATESESDSEVPANPGFKPRPNFSLAPDQTPLGPCILDRGKHISIPASINTYLREYQRDGAKFFWELYDEGRGGLLGDDMGLGKTIQVISFLSAIMLKHGDKRDVDRRRNHVSKLQDGTQWRETRSLPPANATWPTCLIIAPTSVVPNWEREFDTWGYFEVGTYTGARKQREPVLSDFKMGRLDVVITSFDIARRDISELDDLPWSTIIVDEVHRVKNPNSKVTEAYNQFTCMQRFGLTGTTIQNSYMEMWTILDWTNPGRLGTSKQWKGYVVKPLTMGQSASATEEERTKAHEVAMILRDKLLPKFFKRRTKDIIKDQLPSKTDEVVFCPLSSMQIAVYKRILGMAAVQNLIRKDELCDCRSGKKRKECCHPMEKGDVLKFTSVLIKISNHLALILPAPSDSPEQTIRHRELAEVAFPGHAIPKYGTAMLQPQLCGKWGVLDTLLKEWRKDRLNKVLVFTKSVKLLEMLEFHLSNNGYGFVKLDGSTKHRMPVIDKFHQDPDVFIFLISTLAGGTGLNLTGANKVVIFDPNWNPAHDLQAMDRAYRFGQTRDVFVYRLLGAGSIEELIYARQLYKQQQMAIGYQASVQTRYFQGVQGDTGRQGELFGVKNIFKLHEDTLATKMAIEKATILELDWALAHLQPNKQGKSKAEDWVYEADAKGSKEDAELRGLSALLFDDDPPDIVEEDDIHKTLNAIGVKYSHRNDDVLLPSRVEEERARNAIKAKKRQKVATRKKANGKKQSKSPEPEWPPKRKHHKAPVVSDQRLISRQTALIELGMIKDPDHLPVFAQSFNRKSLDEQNGMLLKLDEYSRKRQ